MLESNESSAIHIRDDLRYLVIEGVIGAGKTTLARMIAKQFRGRVVLEEFDLNPFLPNFYTDPERWAFHTQLSFLASRFRQQKKLTERDLFHQVVISDYAFDKDRIFAHVNLQGDELQLYETLYTLMQPTTPVPDLVVYLRSSLDRLMANIAQRGRDYETDMDRDYMQSLVEAYDYYFTRYTRSPLLIVDATQIDFVKNVQHQNALLRQIVMERHTGTVHFRIPDASSVL